jgi:transcriptional regulator with XRE-family HTH domain
MVRSPSPKAPSAIDAHVGRKLKMFRSNVGWSQERLAAAVGLTFQQLNKYENGVNRISAGRLHRFAGLLGIPIQRFFEDTPASKTSGLPVAAGVGRDLVRMLGTDEGVRLRLAFARLGREHQRAVVALVKQIASSTRRR